MCSNTSSAGSYGDPNDSSSGACLKKPKKEKVPRRGPGVAELEKILREQENNFSDHSSPPLFSQSYPMDHSMFAPPPLLPVYKTSSNNNNSFIKPASTNGGSCNIMMPPTISLPEKSPIFPMIFVPSPCSTCCDVTDARTASGFSSSSYFPMDMIPPAPVFQRKQQHSLHQIQMMNLPQPVAVPPLTNPNSVGLFQFIEPPSNQRSCPIYASQLLEEDTIVGAKRPRNFLLNNSLISQMNTKRNTSREDTKNSCSLDLRLETSIPDNGTASGNPTITVDSSSPATPTPNQASPRDFSNSKFIPLTLQCEPQEHIEEYVQRRRGTEVAVNRKPFYSFLPSDAQSGDREQTFCFKYEKHEANREHGIDLRLKL